MRIITSWLVATLLTSGFAIAQPTLNLKTRRIETSSTRRVNEINSPNAAGSGHLLLQFDTAPTPETVAELTQRGITVLQDVPENGLLVTISRRTSLKGLGVRYAAPLAAADKISPLVTSLDPAAASGFFLVEFHPDVDMNTARAVLLNAGFELHENPDLSPHHLMIQSDSSDQVLALAKLDPVGYIFPASSDLVNGVSTVAFGGALTTNGAVAQSIPTNGNGWDGPGLGAATVNYVFSAMTAQLPPAAAQAEIQRAMGEWTKAVKVTWKLGTSPTAAQTVNILWGTFAHGDGFPFDGTGGVLAHTFYPAPPNPEPIAGDMHFDDSERWHIGSDTDLFSVALHELGHALGLGHSDNPAAVMYPYYKKQTGLSSLDISAIQTMYAAQDGATAAPVTPPSTPPAPPANPAPPATPAPAQLTLAVNVSASSTAAATISISGSASGGKGTINITWNTDHGSFGTAIGPSSGWSVSGIPLATGINTITVTAIDSVTHVSQSFVVTRQAATTPTSTDKTPPSLTITTPSATSISSGSASITFSGAASDNTAVTSVTWSTNTGGSGTAIGTSQWTASIPLLVGSNTVTIRAWDAAGNVAWRSAVVSRH